MNLEPAAPAGFRRPPRAAAHRWPARGLLPLVALLAVWQLAGPTGWRSLPPPARWIEAVVTLDADRRVLWALGGTTAVAALAVGVATVVGVSLGLALGTSRWAERALGPSLDFVSCVPGAAVVPLGVLMLGTGRLTTVVIVALAVIWPIVLNIAVAVRCIPEVRLQMARTLGLGRWARGRLVLLPSIAPAALLGVRIAASQALIVTLLVEIVATGAGVGRLLVERQQHFDSAAVWGLILIVGVIGYLTSAALGRVERWLGARWPAAVSS